MNKQDPANSFIQQLAMETIRQQGTIPAPFQTEKDHINATMIKVRKHLTTANNELILGLNYLLDKSPLELQQIIHDIVSTLRSAEGIQHIMQSALLQQPNTFTLFSDAVNEFYDCGDFNIECCVISVFIALFPLEAQPYICLATLIWRKDGIQQAASFYETLIDTFHSPLIHYFAADCLKKSGNHSKAALLLAQAKTHIEAQPRKQQNTELLSMIGQALTSSNR
ncbi:hypothetical protein [uncultured Shewanella sp.]|uniref:hypothetical protein n=1 Tax=uncultured Shewanella sp. TaxID=173975 RepID=UPI0026267464|nr:hypothetical protein [uncultured Shewanella sp.]